MFRACWAQRESFGNRFKLESLNRKASAPRIIVSSSSHSSLHTSAILQGNSSRQHVARKIKKLHIAEQEERMRIAEQNRPSVVLGTRDKDEWKWKRCLLAKILVNEEELFSESNKLVPTKQAVGTVHLAKYSNFGVGEKEKQLLFGTLPLVTSTGGKDDVIETKTEDAFVSPEDLEKKLGAWKEKLGRERSKANAFAKVIDLRNANAAGIAYENRRRIIEAFSTPENPFDPGRSEVQAALLTYKIRNLWKHLSNFRRDLGNRRGLRMLVHQRAKILKYLKKVDHIRYQILLEKLALEPESVEGELVV
ncbi:hypothetical protein C0992_006278 [Termitomyces sp. T32_za158]|nr:hypothetical protein C0992_006278 [Termitomyces sp. T32_za158]